MITDEEFRELKDSYESAKAEAERAKGALDQLMSRLQQEFGVKSVKQADALLVKLRQECETAETKAEKVLKEYKAKWKD